MNKRFSNIFLSIMLCMVLLAATTMNTNAQTPTPATPGVVILAELGKAQISLNGPFDSTTAQTR